MLIFLRWLVVELEDEGEKLSLRFLEEGSIVAMKREATYIRERRYSINSKLIADYEKKEKWTQLLGDTFINNLYKSKLQAAAYLNDNEWSDYEEEESKNIPVAKEDIDILLDAVIKDDVESAKKIIEKNGREGKKLYSQKFLSKFTIQFLREIQTIIVRILIAEIHKKAQENGISDGKYDFFICNYLKRAEYRKELFSEYPVLERCLKECILRNKNFFNEIIERVSGDKNAIEDFILEGQQFHQIVGIREGNSDSHFSGRRVLVIDLDNSKTIVYKPHCIENEKLFGELLGFLGKNCGVDMYMPKALVREQYGWIEYIEQRECKSIEELKRYYYRFGISLFTAYLSGTNDIHCENLIARGEYPVIVDLENLGKGIRRENYINKGMINLKFQESVLNSGMLPYYYWEKSGKGIDLSALAGGDDSEMPFKIPVIRDPRSDNMRISYDYIKIKEKKNRAMLSGEYISPDNFEKEIKMGFEAAYSYTLENREKVKERLRIIENVKSRYLVGDTQKYMMLLSSSYHPAVMRDASDREFLLYSLWRGRGLDNQTDSKIVDGEIYDLLNNDIPYFYFYMNRPDLYDSRGNKISNFFSEAPIRYVYNRLKKTDYERLRNMVRAPQIFSDKELLIMAENIADKLLAEAEYDSAANSVNWLRLLVMGDKSGAINLGPCGVYIYDGIAGILVFLFMLNKNSSKEKYREICRMLEEQLFVYTDIVNKDYKRAQSDHSGIYNGEGSIVYTYFILFMISEEKKYIEYAEKHAKILKIVAEKDRNCDLVDGKAGAIIVFCYMYLLLTKKEYMDAAIDIGEKLIYEAIDMNGGIAWKRADGGIPLLGAAHGNAGILIALSMLYRITKSKKYYSYIKKAISYEHINFNHETGEWLDFRKNGCKKGHTGSGSAAWCHGAGGILLSRIILEQIGLEQDELPILYEDMKKAVSFVQNNKFRKDLCLCHGECGNLLILNAYKERMRTENREDNNIEEVSIVEDIVLTKEWYTPGLMNGYSGIGYYLLLQITDIPNFLFLDVKLRTITDELRTSCKKE